MKRLLFFLLLLIPLTAFAAENLTGLSMSGKNVVVKDGLAFTPYAVTGNATVVNGTIVQNESFVTLAHTENATILYTPEVGQLFCISQTGSDTDTATVLLPTGLTWNGSNRGATFNAAAETLIGFRASASRIIIVENVGTVGFNN
ncbi:MAG: hypothetical protein RBR38_10360 [Desulfomicrobium apsheronum]|nr:hypothetical protein [Desulfomicrobium apsheronum]